MTFLTKPRRPLKRTGFKKRVPKPKVKKPRAKLPTVKTTRNKADALLSPIIIAMYPRCLLCSNPTQVAHHHVHKSKSTRLRYEIDNLVNLCHHCHQVLHHNESYWASVVVQKRGLEWFESLQRQKDEYVKADVHFYISQHARLKALLEEVQ